MLSVDRSGLRLSVVLPASLVLHAAILFASLWLRPLLPKRAVEVAPTDRVSGNTFDVDAVIESGTREPAPTRAAAAEGAPEPEPESSHDTQAPETKTAAVILPSPNVPQLKASTRPRPSAKSPDTRRSEAKRAPTRAPSNKPESGNPDGAANVKSWLASDTKTGTTGGLVYGAQGLPPGVRNLHYAFTRAIPAITARDPIWQELPLGKVGSFRVRIELNEDGNITQADILSERPREPVPLHFARLKQRTVALLGGGQFALKKTTGAGTQTLLVEVTLSSRKAQDDFEPNHVFNQGFDPPQGNKARAYFTLGSGRHFDALVTIVSD